MDGEKMLEAKADTRVRMNFGANAKGFVQMDITVEMPTTEEAAAEARKAITMDKAERYTSVKALLADVEAYLAGRRVAAHDYSAWELLKRFAKESYNFV